jgi:bifunctional non-homologous end joining protein LigD
LLIKHRDDEIREGENAEFLEKNAKSVVSGRTMDTIAAQGNKVWHGNRKVSASKSARKAVTTISAKISSAKSKEKSKKAGQMPAFTSPQLATLVTSMPEGTGWLNEIKFDGYRMISHINNGKVQIFSRNGKDWTQAFSNIADLLAMFHVETAILDGEVVVTDAQGKTNFTDLKNALGDGNFNNFQYYVFDLLYLNGRDLRQLPLVERKELLQTLLHKNVLKNKNQKIFFSEHFAVDNTTFLEKVCSLGLEGVVSKRADAPYHSGRTRDWLKIKCQKRQEFVIGGFTLPSTGALGVGALLLGYYEDGKLKYAGRVGTGFTAKSSKEIRMMLDKLLQKENPYVSVSTEGKRGAIWVAPKLVGEVEFTEWTTDGSLRHPSFKGLREDKAAEEIVREKSVSLKTITKEVEKEAEQEESSPEKQAGKLVHAKAKATEAPVNKESDKTKVDVSGIKVSHPDRIIYPGTHITKKELAEYYLTIADYIMPHIENRPLSMLRCPEGIGEECFFQRHVGFGKSPYLHEVAVTVKGESRDYLLIKDTEGLISLVQWGVIELHPWQCSADNLEKPDRMIFDLDPDPAVSWKQLIDGALEVKERMKELGLECFLKTTGGKGLHIVIPITPTYSFTAIKSFARAVAESMANDSPLKYVAKMSKAKRTGKIFVDYLRNDVTATAVAPYSARARKGATVSTPLLWKELTTTLKLDSFTIETIPQRLMKSKSDPWKDFGETKQKISAKYLKALKIDPS